MKTREQERMSLALDAVQKVKAQPKDAQKEYGRACFAFPPLVRTAGLCQAVAFFVSRDKKGFTAYLIHLDEHLRKAKLIVTSASLRDAAPKAELTEYMLLTREVLACALWHKRLAQSELDADAAGDET
jgi:CRISPR type III-B/RAMP module-associated protein Cmr5